MSDQKQSQFIEVQTLTDSDFVPVFGQSSNRKISKPNLFDQIKDETQIFIYPTTEQLQAADLASDETWPIYVRNAETEFRLYQITSIAPGVNDIALNNGLTATFREEYSDIGFVVGPAVSVDNAIAVFDGTTGTQLENGPIIGAIGENLIELSTVSDTSYIKINSDESVTLRNTTQMQSDLGIDQKVTGPASSAFDAVALFDGVTGKLLKVGDSIANYLSDFLVTLYSIFPRKVDTWAAIGSTTVVGAGQIFDLYQHTSGGIGGGKLISKVGSVTDNNVTRKNSGTVGYYLERVDIGYVTPQMAGAMGNGSANDCDPIRYCISASKNIFLPEGTYLISPTAGSGDFMLYLGTAGGNPDRSGMTIFGTGRKSVIKLGNAVGAARLLFGLGVNDVISDVTFKDFCFDLNATNNLQVNFGDPLRLNSAFYGFGKCSNFLFENIYTKNISGHQAFRIGADDVNKYGDNIRFINCDFENFGIAIPGNNQQDVSVCYIQADRITVSGCTFKNPNFTFDLSRGHTCLELHGDSSTIVTENTFAYSQLPILVVSSAKDNKNTVISDNTFIECNYLFSADGNEFAQRNISIEGNIYTSTKVLSVICPLGNFAETAKTRENVSFKNNILASLGNTNQDTPVFNIEDCWVRSLDIANNTVTGFNGSLLRIAGTIRNTGTMSITVKGNTLDSLGSSSGTSPNDPCFVDIVHSSGVIDIVTIEGNTLANSSAKNYAAVGCYHVAGAINNTSITGATGSVSKTYPVVTGVITGAVTKVIESNAEELPVKHRSATVALAGTSSVNLYDFSGFGNNDNALLELKIYANIGGTGNGTIQSYDVLYSSNGRVVLKQTGAGTYNADVIVELSGTTLRVRSTTATALSFNYVVTGDSSKNIVWLV